MEDPETVAAARVGLDEVPFQGIVEAALAGVYVVCDERFRYVNDTFAAMFGYRVDEIEGMHLRDLVTPDSGDDVMEKYHQRITGEMPSIRYTTDCRHKDGRTVKLEIHGARVLFRGQPALSGMALDITDRIERERQLRRSREQLRELARDINTSREDQRARFARDVHDVLGGMLSSIKMDVARILRRAAAPELSDIRTIATELLTLTQETIDAARRIADESRPLALDSLGLFAAIEVMLEKFGSRSGIAVSFHLEGHTPPVVGVPRRKPPRAPGSVPRADARFELDARRLTGWLPALRLVSGGTHARCRGLRSRLRSRDWGRAGAWAAP